MEISVYKSTSWRDLPWDQFQRKVFGLQCRIYNAMRNNDVKTTVKLQKCLIHSSSTHYLAIKELTEIHSGKKIPDSTGKLLRTFKEKILFANYIHDKITSWEPSPYKKVNIVLQDGTQTFFSIPTIEDRIVHFVFRLAIEPAHEVAFSEFSYGFRVGKNIWDTQKSILLALKKDNKKYSKKILRLDLTRYVRNIDYSILLKQLVLPFKYKTQLYKSLNIGLLDGLLFPFSHHYSLTSVSFLLLNILLNGSERPVNINLTTIRYGSHILYIFEQNENDFCSLINRWLYIRGINFVFEKSNLIVGLDSFDFLGWFFIIKQTGKIINYPNRITWLIHKSEIKRIIRNTIDPVNKRVEKARIKMMNFYAHNHLCNISELNTQFYSLRSWCNHYLRKQTQLTKLERHHFLNYIFKL